MNARKNPAELVKTLRKTVGKSQSQFAAMIGVSKHTIISVENGRNQLSPKLAKLIRAATGADILDDRITFLEPNPNIAPEQLLANRMERIPTGNIDHVYTRQDFERWRTNYYPCNDETARKHFEKIVFWVELIFKTAAKPGAAGIRDRFPAVYQSLVDWLDETRTTFKLEKEVEELLDNEPHSLNEMVLFSPSALDNKHVKNLLAQSGFRSDDIRKFFKKAKPSHCMVIQIEYRRGWDPFLGTDYVPCKTRKLAPKPKFWLEDWGVVFERHKKLAPHIFKDDPEPDVPKP